MSYDQNSKIYLVGASGSGKTTLLTALYHGKILLPADGDTLRDIQEFEKEVYKKNSFPQPSIRGYPWAWKVCGTKEIAIPDVVGINSKNVLQWPTIYNKFNSIAFLLTLNFSNNSIEQENKKLLELSIQKAKELNLPLCLIFTNWRNTSRLGYDNPEEFLARKYPALFNEFQKLELRAIVAVTAVRDPSIGAFGSEGLDILKNFLCSVVGIEASGTIKNGVPAATAGTIRSPEETYESNHAGTIRSPEETYENQSATAEVELASGWKAAGKVAWEVGKMIYPSLRAAEEIAKKLKK